ncbi:cysteine synthase, putative [Aduncisulcus paluster]|uniref:Cysteine synthase, putative n=1 Tax=Aduncisulcus paluster TaxID=2918883 RepID=A0ABQ5KQ94_9EUKA|nr:cysteine synthase, putative [Aduncisulcus paluster]|eukprot:gnl/Carplike_NY0171/625_a852_2238.p1 GENE.gnl/Carplike_NY0171/625_a852_2238~~gnl/Carplike_NY0171/625_a852_2238.p1  ORF type:complete len:492 (+),score=174.36 gnl/Carplike_NY0171/625_a852_2238:32-1507(+)
MEKTPAEIIAQNIDLCRERGVMLPTLEMMRDPSKIPASIIEKLKTVGLHDRNPLNLFRINWHNECSEHGGVFKKVPTYISMPKKILGISSKIVVMCGKYFPTGAHKVGATYCVLVDGLATGTFDPKTQKAIWPSTGNYCRGGAFNSLLLGCQAVAVLPEEMSKERFHWLKDHGAEVHATPGCESNVKEVFDKTAELHKSDPVHMRVFDQFSVMGNPAWHAAVTGPALAECVEDARTGEEELSGTFFTTGSAGTIAASDFLRKSHPHIQCGVGEALQCPTILENGFGGHRIEGIGDKHIPWVYNAKTANVVCALDDEVVMRVFRLFNEKIGQEYLAKVTGEPIESIKQLELMGISGVANMLGCLKMAKYYEMNETDILATVATDSAAMYQSRLKELTEERGAYTEVQAMIDHAMLLELTTSHTQELTFAMRRRVHNLKYFTWIEGMGFDVEELRAQWYDKKYWEREVFGLAERTDKAIKEFNEKVGLLEKEK